MTPQYEGGNCQHILLQQAALGTPPSAPAQGYRLPYTSADPSKSGGFVTFDVIGNTGVPSQPMVDNDTVSGTIEIPIDKDFRAVPLMLQHAIGIAVTTGAADPYMHVQTLGAGLPDAFAIEQAQLDAQASTRYRLFHSGRVNQFSLTLAQTGGVIFRYGCEFLDTLAPYSTALGDPVVDYGDEFFDTKVLTADIGASTAVCYISDFSCTLDYRLQADLFPVACAKRTSLPRMNPVASGTITVFASDTTQTQIDDIAESKAETNIVLHAVISAANREFQLELNNAILRKTSSPVSDSGGRTWEYAWQVYSNDAIVATTYNDVATIP